MVTHLQGIRVLDLTNVLAGPFCCHHLAHFGADVIKVEEPKRGDLARQLGADPDLNAAGMGVSFLAQNAGKRSVTANLKHPEGRALFLRLVETADVVVENFRPGVMDRLGLGYDVLKDMKTELIYCAISGFGQDSPWRARPAYDQIVQGAAGVMSITGDAQSGPLRTGFPVADTVGGLTAAFSICAALNARPRGAFLDVSMVESVLTTMGWAVSNYLVAGVPPQGHGNENMTSAPSGTFETADGLMNIAANKDEQWEALVRLLRREDLLEDPAYVTREDRKAHRHQLRDALEDTLAHETTAHWVARLNAEGIPAGPVLSVPDALANRDLVSPDFTATYPEAAGVGRDIQVVRTGTKVDGQRPAVDAPPPQLGADNDDVYGALGLSRHDRDTLRAKGAI